MTKSARLQVRGALARDSLRMAGWIAISLIVMALGLAGFLKFIDVPDPLFVAAVPFLGVAVIAAFLVPVEWIPSAVLIVLAVVPTRIIPNQGPFNALPPLALIMTVWVIRRVVLGQRPRGAAGLGPVRAIGPRLVVYTSALLFVAWCGVSMVQNGADDTTIGWTLSFVASALLPLVVFDARVEASLLKKVLLIVGPFAAVNVIVESVLGFSPLYTPVDLLLGRDEEFEFAVYRAHGAFSHPLFAAAFLTIPAMIGLGIWLRTGRWWPFFATGLCAAGVVATVSRGPILIMGLTVAGALVITPLFVGRAGFARWLWCCVLSAVGLVAVLNFGPLLDRNDSYESQLSAGVRTRALEVALDSAKLSQWFGTGPGTSGDTGRLFDSIIIENSLLQLLMSVGVPGLLLFLGLAAGLVWCAWARSDLGSGLAVIAYVGSITGFNSLDGVRNMHIVIGLLVLLCLHGDPPARRDPARAEVLTPAVATRDRALALQA